MPPDAAPHTAAPRLAQVCCEWQREVDVIDESGASRRMPILVERALTVFVERRDLVTLMTLGAMLELLVLGHLLNQRLVAATGEVESVTVDWNVHAAAVHTRHGLPEPAAKTAHRVVATGCGLGTVYGDPMVQVEAIALPDRRSARITHATLLGQLGVMRRQDSLHRRAGPVHGSALFRGTEPLMFAEDIRRHRAIDTLAASCVAAAASASIRRRSADASLGPGIFGSLATDGAKRTFGLAPSPTCGRGLG